MTEPKNRSWGSLHSSLIEDYCMIGDCETAALVSREGRSSDVGAIGAVWPCGEASDGKLSSDALAYRATSFGVRYIGIMASSAGDQNAKLL